jgi:hypothetical protein
MLKLIFITLFGLMAPTARPQTIIQLTEQLALDAQKLASIKSTLQDMYRGYEDLQNGYTRIRDLAKDNFNLHEAFLDALWVLSPAVRGDPRLAEIVNTEYRIVAAYQAATTSIGSNPVWTAQELSYITGTFSALLSRSMQVVEELTMVSTDNELRMSDAQRLQSLDRMDSEIKEELTFMERFDNELAIEAARRNQESNDINTLKSLYGLPN